MTPKVFERVALVVVLSVRVDVFEVSPPPKTTVIGENDCTVTPVGSALAERVALKLPPPVPDRVTVTIYVTLFPRIAGFGDCVPTLTEPGAAAAATYGPTNGPPAPTGAAPVGWMKSMPVSARARAMLMRPLPVWSWVPAGSAMRARRPTMTPLVSAGSTARMKAAAPATIAADAEVPLMTL